MIKICLYLQKEVTGSLKPKRYYLAAYQPLGNFKTLNYEFRTLLL